MVKSLIGAHLIISGWSRCYDRYIYYYNFIMFYFVTVMPYGYALVPLLSSVVLFTTETPPLRTIVTLDYICNLFQVLLPQNRHTRT